MNIPCVPPSEQQLIRQYNTLKEELLNDSVSQMNSAFKFNSTMTLLFQNINKLFSNYTKKIASLQKQNATLRSKLPKNECKKTMLLDYIQTQSINFDQNNDEDEKNQQNDEWNYQDQNQDKTEILLKRQNSVIEQTPPIRRQLPNFQFKNANTIKSTAFTESKTSANYHNAFNNLMKNPISPIQVKLKQNPHERKLPTNHSNEPKKKDKAILKQQFLAVSIFAKENLSRRLQYNQNHTAYIVPKKRILKEYFLWCSQNKRNILHDKASTIQMALTNELKILFPQMDSYTKNYRGLKFIDNTPKVYQNNSQNEEIDSLNGDHKKKNRVI